MPASRESLNVTSRYRRTLIGNRDAAVRTTVEQWLAVDFGDTRDVFDRSFRAWLAGATATLTAAQRRAAVLTGIYVGDYLASETDGQIADPPEVDADAYAGRTADGRPVRQVLALAAVSASVALSQRRGRQAALQAGLNRAVRVMRTESMEAARGSLSDAMQADDRIVGWRRQTSARPCGACLGLAARGLRATDEALRIHPACSCTAVPVVDGVVERVTLVTGTALWERMTPAEQDAAIGPEKAQLVRQGDAQLGDLITEHHHPDWPDGVYETPLARLAGS